MLLITKEELKEMVGAFMDNLKIDEEEALKLIEGDFDLVLEDDNFDEYRIIEDIGYELVHQTKSLYLYENKETNRVIIAYFGTRQLDGPVIDIVLDEKDKFPPFLSVKMMELVLESIISKQEVNMMA